MNSKYGVTASIVWIGATAILLLGAGCEVSVSTPKAKAANDCPIVASATAQQVRDAISAEIRKKDCRCLQSELAAAKNHPADLTIVEMMHGLLSDRASSDLSKALAIGYMLFASDEMAARAVDDNASALRHVAESGDEDARATAIAALATRKSDQDVELFLAGIHSGSEMALAYSTFALIDNCSAASKQALRTALASAAMQEYLKKYAGKESISGLIRQRCPAVADALPVT